MGKRILAIGTTNHRTSINKRLVDFASTLLLDLEVDRIDMIPYEMVIFGSDRHEEEGVPEGAIEFKEMMGKYDGFIISLAEHNGTYTAVFKNLIDWLSVLDGKVWLQKPVLLLSTSPGPRGGVAVMGNAEDYFPHMGAKITGSFSLGSFFENFNDDTGITDEAKFKELKERVAEFEVEVKEG